METTILSCGDVLDARHVTARQREWIPALSKAARVAVDTTGLTDVDTAGVQLLLAVARQCRDEGLAFEVRGKSEALNRTLAILGLPAWGQ